MKTFEQFAQKKIIHPDSLQRLVKELRDQHLTLATLNGSFDLLHAGHLEILYQASLQADRLIVALNSDRSVQSYKGPDRPIIELSHRLQMMAALGMVDFVTWFDESDPRALLLKIRPDVHVNGAEYGVDCIERDVVDCCGGRLHLVPRIGSLVAPLATSQIIQKIKKL